MNDAAYKKGLLGWFASNHVAANLLMMFIIVSGLLAVFSIKMEVFPEFSADLISVTVPYRGASPEDVEKGVILRVEEAVAAVDGVKRITGTAAEGSGSVMIEVEEYADTSEVLDDIKAEIDRIETLPDETEKPVVAELTTRHKVITVVLYGDVPEKVLKRLADRMRDDLTAHDTISQVEIFGMRPYEISIEVPEENLRRYNLSFDDVSRAVAASSLDVPAGSVKTEAGEVLLRTEGQMYAGPEFEKIVVVSRKDGTAVTLAEVASVRDEFEDVDLYTTFDGMRAALVKVFRIGDQDALTVAKTVKDYIAGIKGSLPNGVYADLWEDDSRILMSRINLLKKNGYFGLTFVFLCLLLFLDARLAFWITMGIPISFMGAFWLMPVFGISINMISLFALIMSLGLVVDDAIVVGENIYRYRQQGLDRLEAAASGAKEMFVPVVLAVLTTVFAFMPLAYTTGVMGKILRVLPLVVSSVLFISLVEALLILPAHLSGRRVLHTGAARLLDRVKNSADAALSRFVNGTFIRAVAAAVRWRYITLSAAVAVLLFTVGFIAGGYIKFTFFDAVEADNMVATLVMPQGTAVEQTQKIARRIEAAAVEVAAEADGRANEGPSVIAHIATTVGANPTLSHEGPTGTSGPETAQSHLAEINVELLEGQRRSISSVSLKNTWREKVGPIPGVSSLKFVSEIFSPGEDVNIELTHESFDVLVKAAEDLKSSLKGYKGTADIADSFEPGKPELKLDLKESGRMLGLTLSDLARQVRQGFYGQEVQRIQRGRHDVRVMVRYPESERRSLSDIERMRIRLPDGRQIPFDAVADVRYGRGFATIQRADRRRVVNVTADVDESAANTDRINASLAATVLPELMAEYPSLQWRFAGQQRERNESLGSLKSNFLLAMLAIYALLAVQFKSYAQPLIVMSAIPFGIVGATIGHLLLGFNLSILSMFGIVALSGVVVNDSLILIDFINRHRRTGDCIEDVVHRCAAVRFRPIMLTTLTTFFGLAPMMVERSLQARFLIPMAISLAFGVMFATVITLLLVPSLYMVLEDVKRRVIPGG
jgi:multidrug efflux pump subunit AcrB